MNPFCFQGFLINLLRFGFQGVRGTEPDAQFIKNCKSNQTQRTGNQYETNHWFY